MPVKEDLARISGQENNGIIYGPYNPLETLPTSEYDDQFFLFSLPLNQI
jgi:hypothetical protein